MRTFTRLSVVSITAAAFLWRPLVSAPAEVPLYQRFLSPASPQEVVSAKKVDRIAWVDYAEGKRNAFTASAPLFTPVKLTNFTKDDGIMMSAVKISDDGSTVIFLRGEQVNREGWAPNPTADPDGPEHAFWAARTSGVGGSWRVVDCTNPELAPDGSSLLFVKAGQIYRAKISPVKPATEMDRGEKAFITEWGVQSSPRWSPDGRKIAFVTTRTDHSFIMVYDVATRTVKYMSPSVDFDTMPMWVDNSHLIYMRRPGLPFGQQAQQGSGGIGLPTGPAFQPTAAAATGGRGGNGGNAAAAQTPPGAPAAAAPAARGGGRNGGRGAGGGGNAAAAAGTPAVANNTPGLMRATFKGGYTVSFYKADVTTGDAQEIWHNQANDAMVTNLGNNARFANGILIFPYVAGGGGRGGRGGGGGRGGNGAAPVATPDAQAPAAPQGPVDEWDRYYSLNLMDAAARPVLLTPTDGLIEDQTSIILSADGKTFYYCTNAKDIERRHIWSVPVGGGTPQQITTGDGVETYPAPLASGKYLATLSANWNLPQSLGVWKMGTDTTAATQKIVFPTSRPGFPMDMHVNPEIVITHAPDGLEIHNQLFLPKDLKPGERRPAIVFVHGGAQRQMMPAYHYMQFYHWAYAVNEWLASQGYVVMSINYRLGIGYGRSFRQAPNTGANGEAEYQDVLAGGKYLQSRPDVDPNRVGIWGLSYGGLLTSQALARNSDIFKAGVDLAGVHLFGSSLDPEAISYQSSTVGHIDGWKSPVLLEQGDDDRNVAFQQMTGLVQLLRQRDVYFELIVNPDDVHESLLHSRWLTIFGRMETFLHKFLWDLPVTGSK
jgi:dipeptidyl-peptidase 4